MEHRVQLMNTALSALLPSTGLLLNSLRQLSTCAGSGPVFGEQVIIGIAVRRSAPEFKSCCGVYLRSFITTHVPALLPSTGLLLNCVLPEPVST
jgi:hypothetical protein